jgi:hypothetical protein
VPLSDTSKGKREGEIMRYQSRKEAAEARLRHRIGVTPKSEVRAMRAQYRIDNELDRAKSDEIEKLKKGIEKPITKKGEKKKVSKKIVDKPEKKEVVKPK